MPRDKDVVVCGECGEEVPKMGIPAHLEKHWGTQTPTPQWSKKAVERYNALQKECPPEALVAG